MDAENRRMKASGRAPSKSLRRQRNHQNMRVLKLQWRKKVWGGTKGCEPAAHATPAKCCKKKKEKKNRDKMVQDSVDAATALGPGFDPVFPW